MAHTRSRRPRPGDVVRRITCAVCGRHIVSVLFVDQLGWATQVKHDTDFLAGSKSVRVKPGAREWRCPDHVEHGRQR